MSYTLLVLLTVGQTGDMTGETVHSPDTPVEVVPPCSLLCDVPVDRAYGRVEFLWWWLKRDEVPPLVSTGPGGQSTGVPGDEGVSVLYGGKMTSRHDRFIGVRPTLGLWLDDGHVYGLEASAFILERDSSILHIKRVTTPLYQLYRDANTGQWAAEQFAGEFPNGVVRRGSIQVYGRKELFGEDIRGLALLSSSEQESWHALLGMKFLQFRNRLNVTMTGYDEPDLNVLYGVEDNWISYSRFYGGSLGVRYTRQSGPWDMEITLGSGIGGTEQRIRAYGRREYRTPLVQDVRPVGLQVLYTNNGDWTHWVFDAVPELSVQAGWSPTSWLRFQVGYTLIYWLRTMRAADQFDAVNTNQINGRDFTGPANPVMPMREATFWASGFSIGAEIRW